jgi:hypothetical protein
MQQGTRSFGVARLGAVLLVLLAMASLVRVVPAAAAGGNQITIDLKELNSSGVSGTATLTDNGDNTTTVSIKVNGATGDHPAHIHQGTCTNLDPNPQYPLTNVAADGTSTTKIDVSLNDLLASPHAVNLHESATNLGVYIACGEIVQAAGGAAEASPTAGGTGGETATVTPTAAATTTTTTAPNTGVGPTPGSSNDLALFASLATVALALLAGGLVLRRREQLD